MGTLAVRHRTWQACSPPHVLDRGSRRPVAVRARVSPRQASRRPCSVSTGAPAVYPRQGQASRLPLPAFTRPQKLSFSSRFSRK